MSALPKLIDDTSEPLPRHVFISYQHLSPPHKQRIWDLACQLRIDGVDAMIDRFAGVPPSGWAHWTASQIESADFVLVDCTAETTREENPHQSSPEAVGLGIKWEHSLIYQDIFNSGALNTKYIPIIFESRDRSKIPLPLQSTRYYLLKQPFGLADPGYTDLHKRVHNHARSDIPEIGRSIPATNPHAPSDGMGLPQRRPAAPSSLETAVFNDEAIECLTGITVVAFWAQWSEPCRTLLAVLNAAAQSYCARARIISADVSMNKGAVKRFEIQLLPTILVFQNSDLKERVVGKQSLQSLAHLLDKYVKQ